jgi:hypothetical protein
MIMILITMFTAALALFLSDPQFISGKSAIQSMTGCYLVDYSFTETESLQAGYIRDPRIYDVNRDKAIKEWIYSEEISPNRIRLQHVLFGTDLQGKLMPGSLLKHQAEDWEFNAAFSYEFTGPLSWNVILYPTTNPQWTRKITNLDDGLRYQCTSTWSVDKNNPEWSCSNYAPIPGRETRDMGRKDYNTLDRSTRLVAYGNSWLERQNNVKTIHDPQGKRTPLAREEGKTWYVRLPDSECQEAKQFADAHAPFWDTLRQAWDQVLVGDRPFLEKTIPGQPSRYSQILDLEQSFQNSDLTEASQRAVAIEEIKKVIANYRSN